MRLSIPPEILFTILFITFIVFMGYTAILMYHWFKYAMSTRIAILASLIYLGAGFFLLFIMTTVTSTLL